ncbi:MAG: beta-ketoacyl-[acyl-carrier-protein] synthase family protein [Bacteroidales bacterium]|jgi:3-oxoacyl-[acyl-carrier-protein] synthase-1
MNDEILITGIGVVTALGIGVESQIEGLKSGKSGITPLSLFKTSHDAKVGEVKYSNDEIIEILDLPKQKIFSRTTLLGLLAAKEAFDDSGLSELKKNNYNGLKIGLISATSVGGMDVSEKFYKVFREDTSKGRLRELIGHDCGTSTQIIADYLGITGFVTTISTACSSANNAIMLGARMIKYGMLDIAIVGGTDALCNFTINGFSSLGILDKEPCRPFDESRAGLNLGEGAGFVVLQSSKTLPDKIYGVVSGYANANDAFHQTASSAEGEGAYLAMKKAITMSGLRNDEIDYINVHGTGTPNNDASEGAALIRIFGNKVPPFSSTKGFTGHTLGAAGGVESVFSILSLYYGYIWPNLNFTTPMDGLGLIPETSCIKSEKIRSVITNSFGFGGNCTSLIFSSYNRKSNVG